MFVAVVELGVKMRAAPLELENEVTEAVPRGSDRREMARSWSLSARTFGGMPG